ncbi:MAG: tetratricopeptide repeat protein [bacterium]|nr:tetratricopeptide repeat protein [bacterium]
MIKKTVFILTLAIITSGAAHTVYGASKEQLFSMANLSFANGKYEEAIAGYKGIIEKGVTNPDVYYNLGNAYVKTGDAGRAILNYEKSLELSPGNDDVSYNLSLVRKQISAGEETPGSGGLLSGIITLNQTADMISFFYAMLFLTLSLRVLSSKDERRKKLAKLSGAFALITIFFIGIGAIQIYHQESTNFAIVIADKAPVFELPADNGEAVASINRGAKVKVLDEDSNWLKISTTKGLVGWVQSETAGLI